MSRRLPGFTLVEILVVFAIIVVLAAASFPLFKKARESARATTCVSNVKQVGMAIIMYANDHGQKLPPLRLPIDPDGEESRPIWPVILAKAGYMWDGKGELPCGKGVWTCPSCDFMDNTYGGYGVVEGAIFVDEESDGENSPYGVEEKGSLRLTRIDRPTDVWLVGDATRSKGEPDKGWYAIWSRPDQWEGNGPAERHNGKANVCMADGRVVALTKAEIEERRHTVDIVR